MKGLKEIGSFFTSVHGIVTMIISVFSLAALISSFVLRHDAKIKNDYVDTHKALNKTDVDSIVKLRIAPVTDSLRIVSHNQRMLQNNYSNFVEANTNSFDEWKKYMNGLEFTFVEPAQFVNKSVEEVRPKTKIRIIHKGDTIR